MRKVALLLASLGIMAAAYAEQPKLEVTHVGQELYIENESGGADLNDVFFWNSVGLKYGDNWTFGLQAAKRWSMDSDDGIHSTNHRIMLDAWYKVNDDLKVGTRYRSEKSYDRYYARYDWKHGMLWSSGDFWYQSNNAENGHTDNLEMEWFPIGIQYGPLKVGYFLDGAYWIGDREADDKDESFLEQQIRAYATLYKGEKWNVTAEYRVTLHHDVDKVDGDYPYEVYDSFGRNRLYLGASYQATENLNIYAKYGYEVRDWEQKNDSKEDREKGYTEATLGWKYTF